MTDVTFELVHPRARLPTRATEGSAGFDIYACDSRLLRPLASVTVPTGLRLRLPEPSGLRGSQLLECQVRGRSGLAFKRDLVTHVGTIDADYRGEIGVKLWNLGNSEQRIEVGDRIAQLVFALVTIPDILEGKVEIDTARGDGGFGSTGR